MKYFIHINFHAIIKDNLQYLKNKTKNNYNLVKTKQLELIFWLRINPLIVKNF